MDAQPTYISESLGGQGFDYQRQFAWILLQRLMLKDDSQFQLGFEMVEAGKFDDLGVSVDGNSWYLVQCKHTDRGKVISYEDLIEDGSGDFSLAKYLIAYHNMDFKQDLVDKIVLFTNRNLDNSFDKKAYEETELDDLFRFSKGKHLKLKNLEEKMSNALHDYAFKSAVNQISDKLKDLFINKKMDQILIDHHHYLKQLLKIDDTHVSIKANNQLTCPMIKDLFKKLKGKIGEENFTNIKVEENVMEGFWTCNDEPKKTKYHDTIKEFLDKFVLSVSQPNVEELKKEMIDEGRLWMRTWIYPDDLGRMGSNFYEMPWNIIKNEFDEYENSGIATEKPGKKSKPYLSYTDGKEIMHKIETKLHEEIQKSSKRSCESLDAMKNYYISRQILGLKKSPKILDTNFIKELYGTFEHDKCFVLTAQPGMGKSSICQYLAFETQKRYKDKTVFLLYCNNFLTKVPEVRKLEDISKIFANELSKENINFLIEETKTQSIIFMDAFDEMSEDNQDNILDSLKFLFSKANIKIVITGRRHVEKMLKINLNAVFMELEALSQDEQKLFLKKFWANSETNRTKFEKFSNKILGKLKSDISHQEYELSGIPLIMRMLAQIYARPFEKYLGSDDNLNQFISEEKISLLGLLDQFVTRCTEITMNKKYNIEGDREMDDFFKPFVKVIHYTYTVLAVEQIFYYDNLKLFIVDKVFYETLKSFQEYIKNQQSLLVEIIAGEARFSHLVYAEYFAAKHLFAYIGQKNALCCAPEIVKCLENEKNIRILLFSIIESNIPIKFNDIELSFQILDAPNKNRLQLLKKLKNLPIIWSCEGDFCNILKYLHHLHDPFMYENIRGECDKTLLQLAVDNNAQKTQALVIEIIKKNTTCRYPLHYAVKSDHTELTKQLIVVQTDVNLLDEEGRSAIFYTKSFIIFKILYDSEAQLDIIDKFGNNLLHSACANGNLEIVKHLANQNDRLLNTENKAGETPLDIAMKKLHMDVAEHLFRKYKAKTIFFEYKMSDYFLENAELDSKGIKKVIEICLLLQMDFKSVNKNGETALHYAAKYNCNDSVELMLGKNNDILDIQNNVGETPLHIAVRTRSKEVVKFLISHQINLGECILHYAVRYSDEEILKLIIEKFVSSSISLDTKDVQGRSALMLAVNNGYVEKTKLLLENGADLSKVHYLFLLNLSATFLQFVLEKREEFRPKYENLMYLAAMKGYDTFIRAIAECGEDVNVLNIAVSDNHINVVKELINCGAEINHLYKEGKTALHFCKSKEMYDFLVKKGAKEDAKDENGNICLHSAANNGNFQIVKYILERDQNLVHYRNKSGQTALHTVAFSHFDPKSDLVEIAKFLIRKGANINCEDDEGKTSMFYAFKGGNIQLVRFLKNNSAKIDLNDYKGMLLESTSDELVILSLLEVGVDVNDVDKDGRTALHIAARKGESKSIELLLNAGANADILDKRGKYPLNYAFSKCISEKAFAHLATYTSNIDHRDKHGEIPLSMANNYTDDFDPRLLIAKNASIHLTNNEGDTALHLAIKGRRGILAELLVDLLDRYEINRRNNEGHTPLYLAKSFNDVSLVQKMLDKGVSESDLNTAIQTAPDKELTNILEFSQKLISNSETNPKTESETESETDSETESETDSWSD